MVFKRSQEISEIKPLPEISVTYLKCEKKKKN